MFQQILQQVSYKSTWAKYLLREDRDVAQGELTFLECCFKRISHKQQKVAQKKFLNGNEMEIEAILYELITHEFLYRLQYSPIFQPKIRNDKNKEYTPDILVTLGEQQYIIDATVIHSPMSTITKHTETLEESFDAGHRARNIVDKIKDKAQKYKNIDIPLIVFVYLGDNFILSEESVERALFGITSSEIEPEDSFPGDFIRPERREGLLLPVSGNIPQHPNLSAVIACDWLWTLNRNDRGRRLYCHILHHWQPAIQLSTKIFDQYSQMIWHKQDNKWRPKLTKNKNIVAKFIDTEQIEFHEYSSGDPW